MAEDLVKRLLDDGWRLEKSGVYSVWCYRGCKLSIPPGFTGTGKVNVYILSKGGRRLMIVEPAT